MSSVPTEVVDRSKDRKPQSSSKLLGSGVKNGWILLMRPIEDFLIERGVHPNAITVTSVLVSIAAGALFHFGFIFAAGIVLFAGSTFDMIDGRVARARGISTSHGAFFDSTLDRVAEILVFLGILSYFRGDVFIYVVYLILASTTMVSYTRARAEGLGVSCTVGVMQRTERIVYLGAACIFNFIGNLILTPFGLPMDDIVLRLVLVLILLLSTYTFLQRIVHTLKELRKREEEGG